MQQADENLEKENTQGYSLQNKGFLTPRVAAGPAPSPSSQLAWQQGEEEDWIFISPASWSFGTALTPPRAPSLEGLRQPQLLPYLLRELLSACWAVSCCRHFTIWEQLPKHLPQADRDLSQECSSVWKHFQSKRQDKMQNLITDTAESVNAGSSKLVPWLSFVCPLVDSAFREECQWSYFQLSWTCFWLY